MRKLFFIASTLFFIFNFLRVYASPAYGTDTPDKGKISIGYQANLVFRQPLSDSHGNVRSYQHFLDLSYGALDWFAFDGKLGVGDIRQSGGNRPELNFGTGFAGGYGFRILLWNKPTDKTRVTVGFHHISVHPNDENVGGNLYETFLDDWQVDLLASKKFGKFEPFAGGMASIFDQGYRINHGDRTRMHPKYYGGVIAGCGLDIRKDVKLKVEGHFIDEDSLSAGLYYSY